jgi:hypothetical protein
MRHWFARRSSASPWTEATTLRQSRGRAPQDSTTPRQSRGRAVQDSTTPRQSRGRAVRCATALIAVAVWLGGLLALGAIAAPVVFSVVSFPSSADAMTIVFRRFDLVAMACAAILMGAEATGAAAGARFALADHVRAGVSALAGAVAVLEGTSVSPRIAALHRAGAVRGAGSAGLELARLHDLAEWCGKTEVVLLVVVVVCHVVALSLPPPEKASS